MEKDKKMKKEISLKDEFAGKIESISILRIFFASAIAIYHIGIFNNYIPPLSMGVIIFFILTSFLLMYTTQEKIKDNFLINKFVRIVPLYWVLTILTIIGSKFITMPGIGDASIIDIIKSLFFIPCLRGSMQSGDVVRPIVGPAWTLYYTVGFWILFYIVGKINHKYRGLITVILLTIGVIIGQIFTFKNPILMIMTDIFWVPFIFGILSFYIIKKCWNNDKINKIFLITTCILTFIVFIFSNVNIVYKSILGLIIFITFILYFKKMKMPKLINYLGKISFSFYLIHYYVIIIVGKFINFKIINLKSIIGIIIVFVLSTIFAIVAQYIFEEKLGNFIIGKANKKYKN